MKKFLKGQAAGLGIGFGVGTLVGGTAILIISVVSYLKDKHAIQYLEDNESETEES